MIENILGALESALRAAGLPIAGPSIGDRDDKSTWRVTWHADRPPTDEQLTAAQAVIDAFDPDNIPAPVPVEVTPLQIRKALRAAGIKVQVDAYVASLGEEAQEAWDYAISIPRNHPLILAAEAGMNLDGDALFRAAAQF